MRPRFFQQRPPSKGLVVDLTLTDGFLAGGFVAGATVRDRTGTYACTSVGTLNDIPFPVYPGFDFTAATSHYLDIGTGPTAVMSMSFWVKQDDISGNEFPLDLNGTDYISVVSGAVTVNGLAGSTLYVDSVAGTSGVTAIAAATWAHIVVTNPASFNATDLDVGRVTAAYYDGVISDVRLYSRELSATEVLDIFNLQRHRYQT